MRQKNDRSRGLGSPLSVLLCASHLLGMLKVIISPESWPCDRGRRLCRYCVCLARRQRSARELSLNHCDFASLACRVRTGVCAAACVGNLARGTGLPLWVIGLRPRAAGRHHAWAALISPDHSHSRFYNPLYALAFCGSPSQATCVPSGTRCLVLVIGHAGSVIVGERAMAEGCGQAWVALISPNHPKPRLYRPL